MRLTLGKARELLAGYAVAGVCKDDPRVIVQINLARERLMKKAIRWKGMVQRFVFNINNGCLTLPREIETIEGAVICHTPYRIKNQWYEVMEGGPGRLPGNSCLNVMQDRGDNHATFVDLPGARRIRIYGDLSESASARVLIQGFDINGNRVQTYDETTGGFVDGEYIKINPTSPPDPNISLTHFLSVDGVQKPATIGFVRIYAVEDGDPEVPAVPGSDVTFVTDGFSVLPANPWGGGDDSTAVYCTYYKFSDTMGVLMIFSDSGRTAEVVLPIEHDGTSPNDSLDVTFEIDGQTFIGTISGLDGVTEATPTDRKADASTDPLDHVSNHSASFVTNNGSGWDTIFYQRYYFTAEIIDSGTNLIIRGYRSDGMEFANGVIAYTNLNGLSLTDDGMGHSNTFNFTLNAVPVFTGLAIWTVEQVVDSFSTFSITRTVTAEVPAVPETLGAQIPISILHPDDETPCYRRYFVGGLSRWNRDGSTCPPQIMMMAVLRYLPISRDTDWMTINNVGAMQHMLLALRYERDGNPQKATYHEGKAVYILKEELDNYTGDAALGGAAVQIPAFAGAEVENLL